MPCLGTPSITLLKGSSAICSWIASPPATPSSGWYSDSVQKKTGVSMGTWELRQNSSNASISSSASSPHVCEIISSALCGSSGFIRRAMLLPVPSVHGTTKCLLTSYMVTRPLLEHRSHASFALHSHRNRRSCRISSAQHSGGTSLWQRPRVGSHSGLSATTVLGVERMLKDWVLLDALDFALLTLREVGARPSRMEPLLASRAGSIPAGSLDCTA
mmetsp:Transcript_37575/g.107602  ORF Transcript_37575/g.107602 Transcript_37575/m.107602 type:complete len:216 (-) Transcript_37575:18-665(-)